MLLLNPGDSVDTPRVWLHLAVVRVAGIARFVRRVLRRDVSVVAMAASRVESTRAAVCRVEDTCLSNGHHRRVVSCETFNVVRRVVGALDLETGTVEDWGVERQSVRGVTKDSLKLGED